MSGTDPDGKRQKPIDSTRAWSPDATPATPPPLPPGSPKIPGITLQYEIARGGMGVVYSGRQDFLDRRVAVKLLSVELGGDSFVQRFQREAKILAGIKHPNIVACHMAGTTDDGQSYLVMEFIDGPSLKKWIGDHGAISVPAALRMTRATAQALGHAFSLGIIHRDVKAENILLETVTSTALDVAFPFTPKVVDLGLARASDGNASMGLTSPGSVMGTPATMSPEQYDEPDSVDFRSDIYGLGCVLYEMLVGKPAFRARKLSEILVQKRAPQAPDPCQENASVPPAVGALVQSMLAVNREDRPASYKELDERIVELLDALGNRTRSVTKTQIKPVVGEETIHGTFPLLRPSRAPKPPEPESEPEPQPQDETPLDATVVTKPVGGSRPPNTRPPATKPPVTRPPVTKPPATKSPEPAAGLLRTSEINFLAEGLEQGAAATAEPVFQETPVARNSGAAAAPPAKSKAGLVIAAVVLVGGGIGAFFAFGGGGAGGTGGGKPEESKPVVQVDAPKDPNGNGGKPDKPTDPPPATNRPPVVASIDGETQHALKKDFWLEAKASDPDNGDAAKLTYTWNVPDEIKLVSGRNQAKAKFRIEDSLPGIEFDIGLEVSDGKVATKASHKVVTGQVPSDAPLVGFEGKSEFKVDERDGRWVDARLGFVACRASKRLRTLQTGLGTDTYWEWAGSLVSGPDEGTAPAKVGLRFEFGDRAWVISCTRASDDDEADWSIEMMQGTLEGGSWKLAPVPGAKSHQWKQTDPNVADTRGYFSVQRRSDKLEIEIGEVAVPRNQQGGVTEEEMPTVRSSVTVPIPEHTSEPQVTLFVDQGRGEFRVRRR